MPLHAFDTNVFAYAAAIGGSPADKPKVQVAKALLASALVGDPAVVPIQVCLEFHCLLVRKRRLPPIEASRIVQEFTEGTVLVASDTDVLTAAFDLAGRHRLQTYDAVVLAAAARGGCDILYSEDMQDGFEWEGVRVVNPFA